jgi:hypothetical protein
MIDVAGDSSLIARVTKRQSKCGMLNSVLAGDAEGYRALPQLGGLGPIGQIFLEGRVALNSRESIDMRMRSTRICAYPVATYAEAAVDIQVQGSAVHFERGPDRHLPETAEHVRGHVLPPGGRSDVQLSTYFHAP